MRCRILLAVLVASHLSAVNAAPLPQAAIDLTQSSVSGVSSGGYMAVQLHVAYSGLFRKGAGVVAGGPFNCADGGVLNMVIRCLGKTAIPVPELVATTREWEKSGAIDATTNLANSKAYIFSGANDSVVNESTSIALNTYYQSFMPAANIVYKKDLAVEHAMVTDNHGATCLTKAMPFINNCGFDLAGAMLQHLYGALKARRDGPLEGTLTEFEQAAFVTGHGMGTTGWVFIPKTCSIEVPCRVHVALHGCKQNTTEVGEAYVRNAGFNRWADTNHLIVLYPQTGKGATNGCWDWWGYDDANYAKKSGAQMSAIAAMVRKLQLASAATPSSSQAK